MQRFSISLDAYVRHPPIYKWEIIEDVLESKIFRTWNCTLQLVRHAETIYNQRNLVSGQADIPITADGIRQAVEIGKRLQGNYTGIFCSPLSRARATLDAALSQVEHPGPAKVIYDERLKERGLGDLEGKPWRYIKEYAEGNLDFAPQGGETYRQLAQRCASFLLDIRNIDIGTEEQHNLLVLTHMGPMRVFDAFFRNVESAKEMMESSFRNAFLIEYHWSNLHLPPFLRTP